MLNKNAPFLISEGQFNRTIEVFFCFFHIFSVSDTFLQGIDESIFIHQPLVYCPFAQGVGELRYHQVHIYTHTHICHSKRFRSGLHVDPFKHPFILY